MALLGTRVLLGIVACGTLALAQNTAQLPQTQDSYYIQGQETLERMLEAQPNNDQALNIILFVADGAGPTTVTATRILDGQLKGMLGEENVLPFETFPNVALVKTYNTNAQVADSAGTGTAWNTGVKTKQGVIGVNANVLRGDCASMQGNEVTSLLELAESIGLSTGIVSTARLTHATPASNYAKSPERNWEDNDDLPEDAVELGCRDIARQLIEFPYGDGIEIAMGGGRRHFLPNTMDDPEDAGAVGNRTDERDLTQEWASGRDGAVYIWNQEQFGNIDPANTGPILGLFERSHLEYEADRAEDTAGEPSLSEMVSLSIDVLSQNPNGYFLQVESGRVDHASHATNAYRTLTDNVEFANAVQVALDKVDLSNTLIIVTADHAHTMDIAGYPRRGNPILGKVVGLDAQGNPLPDGEYTLAADGKPYTTLGYLNGPGAVIGERPDLTDVDTEDKEFRQQALVPLSSETHDGTDVAAYAIGPRAHLIRGVVEQNYLFHAVDYAAQLTARAAQMQEEGADAQAGDDIAIAGDYTADSVDAAGTLELLSAGLTEADVAAALSNMEAWQELLRSLDSNTLNSVAEDIEDLQTALQADEIDGAEVSELLISMGEKTVAAAENAEFDNEMLMQLGETLIGAGESLQ